jgi:hypothetical protein
MYAELTAEHLHAVVNAIKSVEVNPAYYVFESLKV